MGESRTCSKCGRPLPKGAPGGHCVICLLQLAIDGVAGSEADSLEEAGATEKKAGPSTAVETSAEPLPTLANYRVLQKIGEGGCGIVYLAEQLQPVHRHVALKVIKLGMDTRSVIARFEAERQALALMDHPSIAKVLDAGATDAGRPFFVMELVRGIRITDYCDQNHLATSQRLELLIQVCQAIQHAHQKGIIHRDIKPSNILVAPNESGAPSLPKVIDFGIAKATGQQRLADKTLFTAFEQFIGTPAYMSPEQAARGEDIDTRSDIYSLGVLLYELLTGQPPFDPDELSHAGPDELRRIIREKEPPRPSTRLSTLAAADLAAIARQHGEGAPRLVSLVRGDLDWIVMKTLEKDRNRRYETANGLASDLRRFLNEEPVVARPPSSLYRLQKLVRRNKLAFGAAAAVAAALIFGLGLSTWLFLKEKTARQRAVTAERKATTGDQVGLFLKDMLKGVGPSVALGRDTTILKEILDKTAERIGKELTNQPQVEAELRNTIGEVYLALVEYDKAERMHRRALELQTNSLGVEHLDIANSLDDLAEVLTELGRLKEAEEMSRSALALFKKLLGEEHSHVATALNNLGDVLYHQNNLAEAERMFSQALAMRKKLLGDEHADVAQSLNNLGLVLKHQGRLAEAEDMLGQALATWRKRLGSEHPDLATALNNLALVLADEGHLPEAESKFNEALAMWRKLIGKDEHVKVAEVLDNLGAVLRKQFRLVEAEARHREALEIKRKLFGEQHTQVATSLHNLAQVLTERGQFFEAETEQRKALTIFQNASNGPYAAIALGSLANVLYKQGRLTEAEKMFRDALAMQRELSGNLDPQLAITLDNLGFLLAQAGDLDEAESMVRDALAMRRKLFPDQNPAVAKSLYNLASVLEKQGKLADAEQGHQQALALRRQLLGDDHPDVAKSLNALATLLQREGKLAQTETLASESLSIFEKRLPDDWQTFNSRSLLGASLAGQHKYAEAEPLLLSGYDGMKQREDTIPPDGKARLKETSERLVQLYEAWRKPEQASEWKSKLAELQKPQAKRNADAPGEGPK